MLFSSLQFAHFSGNYGLKMPLTISKDHEANKGKVCAVCFGKSARPLTEGQLQSLKKIGPPAYQTDYQLLPTGICTTCRIYLASQGQEGSKPLQFASNLDQILQELKNIPPQTRSNPVCTCEICRIANARFENLGKEHAFLKKKKGMPSHSDWMKKDSPAPLNVQVCSWCFSEIGRGKPHNCTRTTRRENLLAKVSPIVSAQLSTHTIKQKVEETGCSTIKLNTFGAPMTITAGQIDSSSSSLNITHESMLEMQTTLNLSDRKILKVAESI